jgi:hypothetical protein
VNIIIFVSVSRELQSILEEYEETNIPDKIRTAPPVSSSAAAARYKDCDTVWKERQRAQDKAFGNARDSDRNKVVAETSQLFHGICNNCRNKEGAVVCHDCHSLLCSQCDSSFHLKHIAHNRVILKDNALCQLKSIEYVDFDRKIECKGIFYLNELKKRQLLTKKFLACFLLPI